MSILDLPWRSQGCQSRVDPEGIVTGCRRAVNLVNGIDGQHPQRHSTKVPRSGGLPQEASFPSLLGAAQRTYSAAIRSSLADAGYADMPVTGYWITGFLARGGSGLQDLASRLTVSKQATSRLIEVLVQRGYCDRISDPSDRRRTTLVLTERGRAAAGEIRRAIERTNDQLAARASAQDIAVTRSTLATLVAMGRENKLGVGAARGRGR
jgi:DNA-binding MarR family transcriptional regulator